MDANSKRNLYLFSAFCAFGLVLCQTDVHLVCLPAVWELDSVVTLRCSVQKSSYPSKCVTSNSNSVMFRRSVEGGTSNTECVLSNILSGCSSSGGCNCTDTSKNTTHYIFEYTFTVSDNSAGYWDCSVPCFNGITPLTSSTYDCVNKKVLDFPETATEGSKTKEDLDVEKKKSEDLTISLIVLVIGLLLVIVGLSVYICILKKPRRPHNSEPAPDYVSESAHSNKPAANKHSRSHEPQPNYTGRENGQPKKSKTDKAIPLSSVGRSSPQTEASGDEKTHMIPPTKENALSVPAKQHDPTSTGLGKSASPRLDPLTPDHSKMPSVERNSGAFPRKLPFPGQPPLEPIPTGGKS